VGSSPSAVRGTERGTLRRVLIELDADELDAAVGAWLCEHAACDEEGWAIALDGKDLHGSWDSGGSLPCRGTTM